MLSSLRSSGLGARPFTRNTETALVPADTYLPWSYIALGGIVTAVGIALIARQSRDVKLESQPQSL